MTRGAELTTATISSFKVTAFLDDAQSTPFMNETEVSRPSGTWTYGPEKYWPKNDAVHFFAYALSQDEGTLTKPTFVKASDDSFQATFTYSLPKPKGDNVDASNQPDLVFAFQTGLTEEIGKVKFTFSHALATIRFKIGSVQPGTVLEGIDLVNVRSTAECVVIGDSNDNLTFTWGDPSYYTVLNQTYPSVSLTDGMDLSADYPEAAFMMIPQTLDNNAYLRVRIKVDGVQQTRKLDLAGTTWNANEIHTYTITLN